MHFARLAPLFALAFLINVQHSLGVNLCSLAKITDTLDEMKRVNCRHCDKYFYCIANFNAVHRCAGSEREDTAEIISNKLMAGINSGWKDSAAADRAASIYGRKGGNCAAVYLSQVNCAYDPATKECKK